MPDRILITPRSYGKGHPELFEMLRNEGFDITLNETGSIMTKEQMIEAIAPMDGVIIGVDPLDADVIASADRLRAISKYGVGVDNIDLDEAKRRNIAVSRAAGANSDAVADYAMALMLAVARRIVPIDRKCRQGNWGKLSTRDVCGATLGLIGLGAIGKGVARRAKGFSMKILAYDVYWDEQYAKDNDIEYAEVDDLLRKSDFVSLHLPLMATTEKFIGEREIALMKKDAVLINTARGGLVDEDALLAALREGRLYGAGLDAFCHEPPESDEWFDLDNVVLGSHCAASTAGASYNMGLIATRNLIRDMKGR
ncbi:MAG: phosphoglycerate dehydrogenase [Clostridia bacterium]|nr:phosphoglycerate dehydrogenase [Clostridia bacterium]